MKQNLFKKFFSKIYFSSLTLLLFISTSKIVFAVPGQMKRPSTGSTTLPTGVIELENPFSRGNNLYDFLKALVVDIIIPLGGVIVVMAVIYAGFLFVTAQGNEEQLKKAKRAFTYTAIGAAVLLGAWTIALVIENTIKAVTNITP